MTPSTLPPGRTRAWALAALAAAVGIGLAARQTASIALDLLWGQAVPGPGQAVAVLAAAGAALYFVHLGTAMYGSAVYCACVLVMPRSRIGPAAFSAVLTCWLVEFAQLTEIPAALAERSGLSRLILGSHFDWRDLVAYPFGVIVLAALHWALPRMTLENNAVVVYS